MRSEIPSAQLLLQESLEAMGYDRNTLIDQKTPEKLALYLSLYAHKDPKSLHITRIPLKGNGECVLFRKLPFYCVCAHHLLPMHGSISIAFEPSHYVVGLSSLHRLILHFTKSPQLQEHLTVEIAHTLETHLEASAVAVHVQATHTCTQATLGIWQELETWAFRGNYTQFSHPLRS